MILSFHPCFEGDENRLCAGRDPDNDDIAAIKKAAAVILPQGCKETLYSLAVKNCKNVFPNYDIRFKFQGKTGQAALFKELNVQHPETIIYPCFTPINPPFSFPFVFKFDLGGECDSVFLISSFKDWEEICTKAVSFEKTGQKGFVIQEYMPCENRSLRVVIIGSKFISYWRLQNNKKIFGTSLSKGAVIDKKSDKDLQKSAVLSVKKFSQKTKINLAGFDLIFSLQDKYNPLFLEINYFFGRIGLGGSEKFYNLLNLEIVKWLKTKTEESYGAK